MKANDPSPATRTDSCPLRCHLIVAVNAAAFLIITLLVLVMHEFRVDLRRA